MSFKVSPITHTGLSPHEKEIPPDGKTLDEIEVGPNGDPVRTNCRPFVKGPLDWSWLVRAYEAGRSSLLVGLDILRKTGMAGPGEWIMANPQALRDCLSRSCYNRSLTRLEDAGLIKTDRKCGAVVRVKVVALLGVSTHPSPNNQG
jgi:hypothetical protein